MKTTKITLLFYNSILVFTLITTGFLTQPYNGLTPVFLLIPVWLYFVVSLIDKIIEFSKFTKNTKIAKLVSMIRVLRIYSLIIVIMIIISSVAYSNTFFESTLTILFLPLFISFFIDIFNKANYAQFTIKNIINIAKVVKKTNKSKNKKEELKEGEIVDNIEVPTDEKIKTDNFDPDELSSEDSPDQNEEINLKLEENLDSLDIKDQKRRQFLRIVGGGGVSMFLMLFVFQQKAQAAFFGSGGGPGVVAVKDSSGTTIDPAEKQPTDGYNIAELDDNASPSYYGFTHKNGSWYIAKEDSSGSYRYSKGISGFSTNWTNRAILSYDYFDTVF
jgi:hypothetical protein